MTRPTGAGTAPLIAVAALVAVCFINTEAQYLAAPAYGYAAFQSAYAAYSPYYYGSYAAYPAYYGWGSNKGGAPATGGQPPAAGPKVSLTNNQ